jgi:hypothetical protein
MRQEYSSFTTLNDMLKVASIEVLLKSVIVSAENGTTVYPIRCPAVGRSSDYGKDASGEAACVYNGNNCKYFVNAEFTLEDYTKKIVCSVG